MSRFYDRLILGHPLAALALLLAVIGVLSLQLPNLRLDASADSLTLEGDQSLAYYRDISERYATEDFLLVTYSPDAELMSDASINALSDLQEELSRLPGVSSVTSMLDVPLLDSPRVSLGQVSSGNIPTLRDPGLDRELARREFSNSPLYRSLLTSVDGDTAALQVNLERDVEYNRLLDQRQQLRDAVAAGEPKAAELAAVETAFTAHVAKSQQDREQLVGAAREIIDRYRTGATIFLGGVPMIASDMLAFVQSDLVVFGTGIVLFIVLLLLVIFRSLIWTLLPLATCVLTVTFMLGLLATLDWSMTVISSNFVALLLIITLAITIHLVVRYRELATASPDADPRQLVLDTVNAMARPCFYTALTTLVAFASLVISGIRPVIDFGWMMTIGVCVAFVQAFVVLPAVLVLIGKVIPSNETDNSQSLTRYFAMAAERFGGLILAVAAVLLVTSLYGISQLKVENRFIDYFDDSTEIYQGMEKIDAELGGTIPLDIVLDAPVIEPAAPAVAPAETGAGADDFGGEGFDDAFGDDFADDAFADDGFGGDAFGDEGFGDDFGTAGAGAASGPRTMDWFTVEGMKKIQAVHNYVDGLPETGKVLSLATLYELMLMILGPNVDDLQLALARRALPAEIEELLIKPYYNAEAGEARITVRVMETSRSLQRDALLKQVRSHLTEEMGYPDEDVHLTGMLVLYNNMLQSLYTSQILTLGAVFVAIMLMFMVLFRSLSLSLIALAPNLLAAGCVLGAMGLAGIPLDMMNITIAAITVGIGVDHAIHYVHRFRQEFPKDRNYLQAMYRCHGSIGKAMYYTAIIIIFGFSILALSNFRPSIYFGLLTGGAMLAALLGSMLLLPRLIVLFRPLGPESR